MELLDRPGQIFTFAAHLLLPRAATTLVRDAGPISFLMAADELPEVSAEEANALVRGGAFLLDVREPDEWQAGHAPEAIFLPIGQVEARIDELPRDRQIVTICRVGGRSAAVVAALNTLGYDAVNVAGGMRAWEADDLPVVADDGLPGAVI